MKILKNENIDEVYFSHVQKKKEAYYKLILTFWVCFDRTCQSTHSSSVQLGVMQQSNHFELGEKLLYLNQILTEKLILFHKRFLIRRGKHKHVLHI